MTKPRPDRAKARMARMTATDKTPAKKSPQKPAQAPRGKPTAADRARVPWSVRLPAGLFDRMRQTSDALGMSQNDAAIAAVEAWVEANGF